MITLDTHVSDIVRENPRMARVFEGVGINYCCGGKVPLGSVCKEKGLDPFTFVTMLNIQNQEATGTEVRVDGFPTRELVGHIVKTHHDYLRREIPRLQPMVHKVAKGHVEQDPHLTELATTFDVLIGKLIPHQDREEKIVFPKIPDSDGLSGMEPQKLKQLIQELEQLVGEHQAVGNLLEDLNRLTDGYQAPDWACPTTLAMFQGLKELEADIHQHVHKENNILFPRIMNSFPPDKNSAIVKVSFPLS